MNWRTLSQGNLTHRLRYGWATIIVTGLLLMIAVLTAMLWQTKQQLAELRPDSRAAEIEARILAQLDEEARTTPADPWSSMLGFDPFADLRQMQQRMDALLATPSLAGAPMSFASTSPEMMLEETEEDFRLRIVTPEDHEIQLNTEVEDRALHVSGVINARQQVQSGSLASSFSSRSQFSRRFDLPADAEPLGLRTEKTEEGLEVIIPKKRA